MSREIPLTQSYITIVLRRVFVKATP